MTTGDVEITILDNGGSVVVPSASTYLVAGCSSAGTPNQLIASRNTNNLIAILGYGPLVEACAMIIARGGTVIAVKVPSNTAGVISAVVATALAGTSVVTVTGTPFDTSYFFVRVIKGGTIGTAGIQLQISADAGRSFGPTLNLGTSTTLVITNTGITLNFGAGTLTTGATYTFASTEPLWNTAGIQAALGAYQTSQYALNGVGGTLIVGNTTGANGQTIYGYLDTLATGKVFTRALMNVRDATPPSAYSGTGETEAAWTALMLTESTAFVDAKRICCTAGHYNMPSQVPNQMLGAPRYRRPYSWALACRQVQIPPQRHAGRVKDGGLIDIVVDPTIDPQDGFIYHDERINPTLAAGRFAVARSRIKKTGFYADNPLLMSAAGSVFTILPLGIVMDIACGIVSDTGQEEINDDIRLNPSGTIYENAAVAIETAMGSAIKDDMLNTNMISGYSVAVDRTNNVRNTSKVNVTVSIQRRGYIQEMDATIGFDITATS